MYRRICVLVLTTIPVLPTASADEDMQKEFKALEGKWKAVALEAGGKPLPKDGIPEFTFVVAAEGKATGRTPQGEFHATITVDLKASPKTIDNLHESGAHKGKRQYGIYKLEGDKWTVCMTPPGAPAGDRPKDFTTKDTANVVFVFERVPEDKKR
jgi:uncharacterized protein (TIGR03067 family)